MKLENALFYAQHPSLLKWRKIGFNTETYRKLTRPYFQRMGIRTILDVGANAGQSVLVFKLAFPQTVIHAVEPLPDCFSQLTRNTAGLNKVHLYNTAVGNQTGNVVMAKNEYTPSSSVLTMADTHQRNFPYAVNCTSILVPVDKLDNILSGQELIGPMLVKIDVQGYEKAVIEGGREVLSRASLLLIELSFAELYNGQPLFANVCAEILSLGFRYAGAFDQLISPLTGEPLQQDAIFVR